MIRAEFHSKLALLVTWLHDTPGTPPRIQSGVQHRRYQ